jgi:putative peptidoglycan lipid II flippase
MPHGGLALANSLATALEAAALLVLMRRRLNGLEGRMVAKGGIQAVVAALAMSLVVWGWQTLTIQHSVWLVAGGGVILGAVVYGLGMLVLGVQEARGVVRMLARRVGMGHF